MRTVKKHHSRVRLRYRLAAHRRTCASSRSTEPVPIPTGTVTNTYAAKFICGVQPDASIKTVPDAQAGHYSTKINVHNNTGINIRFRKKMIQLKGGRYRSHLSSGKFEALKPDWAMEVVCRDIYGHLNIPISARRGRDPALYRRLRDL